MASSPVLLVLAACLLPLVLGLPVRLPLYTDVCARSLVLPVLVDDKDVSFPKLDTGAHMIALFERTPLNVACLSRYAKVRFPTISEAIAIESDGLMSRAESESLSKWLEFGKSFMRVHPREVQTLKLLPDGPAVEKKSIKSVLAEIPSDPAELIEEIQDKLSEKSKTKGASTETETVTEIETSTETVVAKKGEGVAAADFVYNHLVSGETIKPSVLARYHVLEYTGILGFAGMTSKLKHAQKAHITSFFKETHDTVCFDVERTEAELDKLEYVIGHLEIGSREELVESAKSVCKSSSFPIEFGSGYKRQIRFPATQVKVRLNGEELVLCSENCLLVPDTGNPAHVHLSEAQFKEYETWYKGLRAKDDTVKWEKTSMQFDIEGGHSLTWSAAADLADNYENMKYGDCAHAQLSPLKSWKDNHFLLPLSFFADRKICLTYDVEKRVPTTLDILHGCEQTSNTATDEEDDLEVESTVDHQETETSSLTLKCEGEDWQSACYTCRCENAAVPVSCFDDTCTEYCSCVEKL
eukprot:GILK01001027.1.p1 GENE.GILK01001027.1~~GILK01001027.1.p1  ORF type:complete len:538 (+),score=68.50 GILK01001027.1:38-1615(+)